MSHGDESSSTKHSARRRKRRRRSVARLILGNPYAHATEYPGFFVLPRRNTPTTNQQTPTLREFGVVLLLFAGFVAGLVYLFSHVTTEWTAVEPSPAQATFVHDPKQLGTNTTEPVVRPR